MATKQDEYFLIYRTYMAPRSLIQTRQNGIIDKLLVTLTNFLDNSTILNRVTFRVILNKQSHIEYIRVYHTESS